jgi:hypothetical protein
MIWLSGIVDVLGEPHLHMVLRSCVMEQHPIRTSFLYHLDVQIVDRGSVVLLPCVLVDPAGDDWWLVGALWSRDEVDAPSDGDDGQCAPEAFLYIQLISMTLLI